MAESALFVLSLFTRMSRRNLLAPILLVQMFFLTVASSLVQAEDDPKSTAATKEEIFLYRGIGASFLCNARSAEVDFPKAVGIAAATYAQVLNGRHGGVVASAGDKKLTNKQLFAGAEFQIITGALQYCPKQVPDDVKEKVQEAMDSQGENK